MYLGSIDEMMCHRTAKLWSVSTFTLLFCLMDSMNYICQIQETQIFYCRIIIIIGDCLWLDCWIVGLLDCWKDGWMDSCMDIRMEIELV